MIRLIDLNRVVGRRLTRKLLQAGWIVPVQSGPGGTTFEAEKVHRALGRLTREGYTLLPCALSCRRSVKKHEKTRSHSKISYSTKQSSRGCSSRKA